MAKNYANESYAVNKYSEGIVYRGTDGDYEITLESFLKENPNMTEEDFAYWKSVSDELYKEEDIQTTAITRKNVSINEIEETQLVSVESAEFEFLRLESEGEFTKEEVMNPYFILEIAKQELPEIQLRRFISRYIEGKTEDVIAAEEGVNQSSISRSLSGAENKIKKVIRKLCIKNGIFDVI